MPNRRAAGLLCFAASLAAQSNPGSLHGVLTDNSGAVIPAAVVTLSNDSGWRSTLTHVDGSYTFTSLGLFRETSNCRRIQLGVQINF